jgi:hypothetical protein
MTEEADETPSVRQRVRRTIARLSGANWPDMDDLRADLRAVEKEMEALNKRRERLLGDVLLTTFDLSDQSVLTDAQSAEIDEIGAEIRRVADKLDAIQARVAERQQESNEARKRRKRTANRMGMALLAIQFATVAIGLIWTGSPKHARGVHLAYYAAVAAAIPVLLVAGFVELGVLRLPFALWAVLSFAVPVCGAEVASLWVLGSQRSTAAALFLTEWGLAATFASLVLYVAAHATEP